MDEDDAIRIDFDKVKDRYMQVRFDCGGLKKCLVQMKLDDEGIALDVFEEVADGDVELVAGTWKLYPEFEEEE